MRSKTKTGSSKMFLSLYRLSTSFLLLVYPILLVFPGRAGKFLRIRREEKKKFRKRKPSKERIVWMHSASVGELDQAKAIREAWRKLDPTVVFLQTVTSDSVSEKQLSDSRAEYSIHLPPDLPFFHEWILDAFHPEALVFVAWDVWPRLAMIARKRKLHISLVCAVFPPKVSFWKKALSREVFSLLDVIYTSHTMYEERFLSLGVPSEKLSTKGDSRFDSVCIKIESAKQELDLSPFRNPSKSKILLLASTYTDCLKLFAPLMNDPDLADWQFWIFPHKTQPEKIRKAQTILDSHGVETSLYSARSDDSKGSVPDTMIFDTIGILAFAYQYADLAYVGGALKFRVHNTIEPAYFGLPILTGPKIANSPEAQLMKKNGGLKTMNAIDEAKQALLTFESWKETLLDANREFVQSNRNAASQISQSLHSEICNKK